MISFHDENKGKFHNLILSQSGKGKSIYSELLKDKFEKENSIIIDLENNPELKGLLPYEYVYARHLVSANKGSKLPRGLKKKMKNKNVLILSDKNTDNFSYIEKTKDKTIISTKNANIQRYLLSEGRSSLADQSGIKLNEKQFINLIEPVFLDKKIEEYNEIETTLREELANALSQQLINKKWLTYADVNGKGLSNYVYKDSLPFAKTLNEAAKNAGYQVLY